MEMFLDRDLIVLFVKEQDPMMNVKSLVRYWLVLIQYRHTNERNDQLPFVQLDLYVDQLMNVKYVQFR